jgi:hypothetical protein
MPAAQNNMSAGQKLSAAGHATLGYIDLRNLALNGRTPRISGGAKIIRGLPKAIKIRHGNLGVAAAVLDGAVLAASPEAREAALKSAEINAEYKPAPQRMVEAFIDPTNHGYGTVKMIKDLMESEEAAKNSKEDLNNEMRYRTDRLVETGSERVSRNPDMKLKVKELREKMRKEADRRREEFTNS